MLSVMLGHVCLNEHVNDFLGQWRMPVFFFISGWLCSGKYSFRELARRRFWQLIVPYTIFFAITFGYWAVVERRFGRTEYSVLWELAGLPYGTYEGGHLYFNGVLWFLPCLFVTELLFHPLSRMKSKAKVAVGVLGYFVVGQILLRLGVTWLPWGTHTALNALLFYGAGFLFRDHAAKVSTLQWQWLAAIVVACLCVQSIYLGHIVSNIKVCTLPYAALAFFGIAGVMALSMWMGHCRPLEYIGRNTLALVGFHGPVTRVAEYLTAHLTGLPIDVMRDSLPLSIVGTIITLIICLPIIEAWKPVMRWIQRTQIANNRNIA